MPENSLPPYERKPLLSEFDRTARMEEHGASPACACGVAAVCACETDAVGYIQVGDVAGGYPIPPAKTTSGVTYHLEGAPGEGGWYSTYDPEPIAVIEAWDLDHHRASILQYLVRYPMKGGVEDLRKARWYLDRLIALEEADA